LIVIDPASAYLKGVDDNRNAVLRDVLTPLYRLAERLGAAVVLVSHLRKGVSANAKHRVLGSIAYVGACRANHLFVNDPHDPTGRRVLMLDNGGNLAPPAPPLAYVIEDRGSGVRVEWCDEPVPITVAEALRPEMAPVLDGKQTAGRLECDGWLRTFLAGGLKQTIDVFKVAPPPVSRRTSSDAPSTASARSPRETASRKMVDGAGAYTLIHASIEIIQRLHKESLFPQRLHKAAKIARAL